MSMNGHMDMYFCKPHTLYCTNWIIHFDPEGGSIDWLYNKELQKQWATLNFPEHHIGSDVYIFHEWVKFVKITLWRIIISMIKFTNMKTLLQSECKTAFLVQNGVLSIYNTRTMNASTRPHKTANILCQQHLFCVQKLGLPRHSKII